MQSLPSGTRRPAACWMAEWIAAKTSISRWPGRIAGRAAAWPTSVRAKFARSLASSSAVLITRSGTSAPSNDTSSAPAGRAA